MPPDELQIFSYGEFDWDVTAGQELVAGREPHQVDIAEWVTQLSSHCINEEHWPTVDLSKPLIIIPMPGTNENRLIDGWHRVRLADAEGITALPAHILSQEEEKAVRRYGGE